MVETATESCAGEPIRARLARWMERPPGRYLLDLERGRLEQVLPDLFGFHIVQLGFAAGGNLLESSRIGHKVVAALHDDAAGLADTGMTCRADALPLKAESVDVVVVPHVLEFASNPHRVLREVERVLIGDGHIVLIGFNPWSLWGLWRLFLGWREEPPWCGHFYGLSRIRDWLSLLDFEMHRVERIAFRPPLRHRRFMARLAFLEKLGRHLWPVFGGAYVLLARKCVVPLTPVKMRWRARRSMIAGGLAEPSARSSPPQ